MCAHWYIRRLKAHGNVASKPRVPFDAKSKSLTSPEFHVICVLGSAKSYQTTADISSDSGVPPKKTLAVLATAFQAGLIDVRIQMLPRSWRYIWAYHGAVVPVRYTPNLTLEEFDGRTK